MKANFRYLFSALSIVFIAMGLLAYSDLLSAQDVSFSAQAPRVIRTGEQFQLIYTINQSVSDFTPPDFGDFTYLGGPMTGSSTSISMVNGSTTRSSTYTFTYYLQAPANAGVFQLGAASATCKRNTINSNTLSIEVVGSSQSQQSTGTATATTQESTSTESNGGEDLFVRLQVDKKTAFVGEQITAWVKFYTKVNNVTGINQQFKGPDYVGFYKQDVEIPALNSLEREKVGNEIYYSGLLRKVILYPQKSGEYTVEPFELLVEIQKQTRKQAQSIFDEFFGGGYQRVQVNLKSLPVKLNIKALPSNQPVSFSGAVGKFSLAATINETHVKTNDAITFKVNVTGKGNIKLIENLKTDFPPVFDSFEPVVKSNTDNSGSGSKTFEYTIIPRSAGDFEIAPFELSYFDLDSKQYKTLTTQSFQIKVDKGANDSTTMIVSNLSKEDVKLLGSDIRYIETETKLTHKNNFIFGSVLYYSLYCITLILFILLLFVRKEKIRRSSDVTKTKNRKAGKVATKRLKLASQLLKAGDKDRFYDEIGKALWGYLSDKLSIPVSDLSREKIQEKFYQKAIDKELALTFFNLSDHCEYARFAPGDKEADMNEVFTNAGKIISKLDQNL